MAMRSMMSGKQALLVTKYLCYTTPPKPRRILPWPIRCPIEVDTETAKKTRMLQELELLSSIKNLPKEKHRGSLCRLLKMLLVG